MLNVIGVETVKDHGQAGPVQGPAVPDPESATLEALEPDHESVSVPVERLDHVLAPIGEHEAIPVQRDLANPSFF